ncbi:Pentatricopeptide repeat [Dillenia turbinata]|uniref:Pentatricopeptide repeat n=1 Tax=Dillenia turbinata TaxID=194707 RepID=A0AAN8YZ19_9MAGN
MPMRMHSKWTLLMAVIKRCKTVKQIQQVHSHTITASLLSHNHHQQLLTSILSALTLINLSQSDEYRGRLLSYAVSVFNLIPNPSTFCYNTMIRLHTLLSNSHDALLLFVRMRRLSIPLDSHTIPFVLKSAAASTSASASPSLVPALHSQAFLFGFLPDPFVLNSLISLYSLSGHLPHACQVFEEAFSSSTDIVSFNALLHALLKAGHTLHARLLFDRMPLRDPVSWATLLSGYVRSHQFCDAILLFRQMLYSSSQAPFRPDNVALVSALSACAHLGALQEGQAILHYIQDNRIPLDVFLSTALVDMFAKCGCIQTALDLFEASQFRNLFTWNALISGLAMHGDALLALHYFSRMIAAGVQPDGVTFLGLLAACCHAGLLREAQTIFYEMEVIYGVPRELKHYGCMADLLGRAGLISEAVEMIEGMPSRGDVFVWGGLLGGCRIHANAAVAEKAAKHVMEVSPEDGGVYSVMAGVYASVKRWDDLTKIRELVSAKRLKKNAGYSRIQLDGVIHEFVAGDRLHPQTSDIYSVLDGLREHQLEASWAPSYWNSYTVKFYKELLKGDYVPVFVALGMIVVSVSFGLHTAKQQLKHCPGVWVRKDKRETLPEVVEPDLVEEKAQCFIDRSFFRKVAHIQDSSLHNAVPNPIRGDPFVSKPRAESLKSVGIDPKHS